MWPGQSLPHHVGTCVVIKNVELKETLWWDSLKKKKKDDIRSIPPKLPSVLNTGGGLAWTEGPEGVTSMEFYVFLSRCCEVVAIPCCCSVAEHWCRASVCVFSTMDSDSRRAGPVEKWQRNNIQYEALCFPVTLFILVTTACFICVQWK